MVVVLQDFEIDSFINLFKGEESEIQGIPFEGTTIDYDEPFIIT